jgi:hypothetical protein
LHRLADQVGGYASVPSSSSLGLLPKHENSPLLLYRFCVTSWENQGLHFGSDALEYYSQANREIKSMRFGPKIRAVQLGFCFILALSPFAPGLAADLDSFGGEPDGVPCQLGNFSGNIFNPNQPSAQTLPFAHVWYGHFSGGRPFEQPGISPRVLIDWQDEKLCFASNNHCNAWIARQRREFHHPEGYWTCLPLR